MGHPGKTVDDIAREISGESYHTTEKLTTYRCCYHEGQEQFSEQKIQVEGLTKFEYFFAAAIQGVEGGNVGSTGDCEPLSPREVVNRAEAIANLAIKTLAKRRMESR